MADIIYLRYILSKQSGNFEQNEVAKQTKSGRKRRGPWELWATHEYHRDSPWGEKFWTWMIRDYDTKELAETAADKFRREKFYTKIEIRYNERKA